MTGRETRPPVLRVVYLGLHVTAALAAAAFLIEGADRYSSLLVQIFLHGIGLGTLLRVVHAQRQGKINFNYIDFRRDENRPLFLFVLFVLAMIGLTFEGVGLLLL